MHRAGLALAGTLRAAPQLSSLYSNRTSHPHLRRFGQVLLSKEVSEHAVLKKDQIRPPVRRSGRHHPRQGVVAGAHVDWPGRRRGGHRLAAPHQHVTCAGAHGRLPQKGGSAGGGRAAGGRRGGGVLNDAAQTTGRSTPRWAMARAFAAEIEQQRSNSPAADDDRRNVKRHCATAHLGRGLDCAGREGARHRRGAHAGVWRQQEGPRCDREHLKHGQHRVGRKKKMTN